MTIQGQEEERKPRQGCDSSETKESFLQWSDIEAPPSKRDHSESIYANGILYEIGGQNCDWDRTTSRDFEAWNFSTRSWSKLAPMNYARYNFAAVAVNGKIYVFGGTFKIPLSPHDPDYDPYTSSMLNVYHEIAPDEVYDIQNNKWTILVTPRSQVSHSESNRSAAAMIDHCIYKIGGYNDGASLDHFHVLDTQTNKWDKSLKLLQPRHGCLAVAIGTKIYVMDGESQKGGDEHSEEEEDSKSNKLSTFQAYDVLGRYWEFLPDMPSRRHVSAISCALGMNSDLSIILWGSDGVLDMYSIARKSWSSHPLPRSDFPSDPTDPNDKILYPYKIKLISLPNRPVCLFAKFSIGWKIGTLNKSFWSHEKIPLEVTTDQKAATTRTRMDTSPNEKKYMKSENRTSTTEYWPLSNEILKPKPRLLYIDAANYSIPHFFGHIKQPWSLSRAEKNVKRFCEAATGSGWIVVAFLDQAIMTKEAQKKWRKRREKEVRAARRDVPAGALRIVGDLLASCGVKVLYSIEADNDDTLAFHAQADGASVLSQDKDFLRYRGSTYTIYKNFEVKKGKLALIEQDKISANVSCRDIMTPPRTGACNPFRDCLEQRTYLRGTPSPLIKLGNLHITVRPLRQALYHHLGLTEPIEEEFPTLVNGQCVWDKTMVYPDNTMSELLLSNPSKAVEYFRQVRPEGSSNKDWYKHLFSLNCVVAELCCTAQGGTLLDFLKPLMKEMDGLSPSIKGERKTELKIKSHYQEWRAQQNTGETNKDKRERYLQLFPEHAGTTKAIVSKNNRKNPKPKSHYQEWRAQQKTGETNQQKRERYLQLFSE